MLGQDQGEPVQPSLKSFVIRRGSRRAARGSSRTVLRKLDGGFLARGLVWVAALGSTACQQEGHAVAKALGIEFESSLQELGKLPSGITRSLRFPFRVSGEPVTIDRVRPDCGCVNVQVLVEGEPHSLSEPIPPGKSGEIVADFVTAGFRGTKNTEIRLEGKGAGLPLDLKIEAYIEAFFQLEPEFLKLLELAPGKDSVHRVKVTGRKPFRLDKELVVPEPLEIEGLPSARTAKEQYFELIIPGNAPEGRQTGYLELQADNGLILKMGVQYEMAVDVWVKPADRLHIGRIPPGKPAFFSVDVGVRKGDLATPRAEIEGFPGAKIEVRPLVPNAHYRIGLQLPADLPQKAYKGSLKLKLPHQLEGQSTVVERTLDVYCLVQDS